MLKFEEKLRKKSRIRKKNLLFSSINYVEEKKNTANFLEKQTKIMLG